MSLEYEECVNNQYCISCDWWSPMYDGGFPFMGDCNRFPPQVVWSPNYNYDNEIPKEFNPSTNVLSRCGEHKHCSRTEFDERNEAYEDGRKEFFNELKEVEHKSTSESRYNLSDRETHFEFDKEYYSNSHNRYWCVKCNRYTDVDKGTYPSFCCHCGRIADWEAYG